MKLLGSDRLSSRRKAGKLIAGSVLIFVGLAVVIAAGIYYALGRYNSTQLHDLNAAIQGPVAMPSVDAESPLIQGAFTSSGDFKPIRPVANDIKAYVEDQQVEARAGTGDSSSPVGPANASATGASSTVVPSVDPTPAASGVDEQEAQLEATGGADLVYAYSAIYPGYQIHPKYWDKPLTAGASPYAYGAVKRPDGFVSVESSQGLAKGTAPDANHIRIPSIGVDSAVSNLAIIDIGDSRQYETPKHVVGRIPETSNPGELGNTWLFGHLESPIRGEGNVFQKLPDIPALVNSGDPVYVSILNEDGDEFLYQVTATEVVHQDDLKLYETDESTVTLVSCVPRLVYDHRLLVTGKLVGVKKAT